MLPRLLRRIGIACPLTLPLRSRALSTAPTRCEQVSVPARSNGAITVDIFHSATPSAPVLIYLPSGPVIPDYGDEEERIISTLAAASKATIARINYRASPVHQFPTPYHDVLFGFDWIRKNLLPHESNPACTPYLAKMGVCGELLGGSLATMLALTECHRGESRIGAAAVNNPIVDWVFPDDLLVTPSADLPEPPASDETSFPADQDLMAWWSQEGKPGEACKGHKPTKRGRKPPPTSWHLHAENPVIPALTLSGERDVLFRRQEDFFDRFASPIHFFRSPHGYLLYPQDEAYLASASLSGRQAEPLDIETQMTLNHYESFDPAPTTPEISTLAPCRSYARIYPPAGTNINLPAWHITTGTESPLSDQASELDKMVKRSIARQTLRQRTGRGRWLDPTEKEVYEVYAKDKVQLLQYGGVGLWTQQSNNGWASQLEKVGAWMSETWRLDSD